MIAGAFYRWGKDEEGQVQQVTEGLIVDLEGQLVAQVQSPPETTLAALEWSPIEDKILGALSGEKNTVLGLWDSSGASLGQVVEIPNPAQEILSASHVAWSPDGQQIAFGLRRWYWWGESQLQDRGDAWFRRMARICARWWEPSGAPTRPSRLDERRPARLLPSVYRRSG